MRTKYAKLMNGGLKFAPENKQNILNYNCNPELLKADGYKPIRLLPDRSSYVSEDGTYSFAYVEQEDAIVETAVFTPYTYAEKRALEYPDFRIFLDAEVKINSGNETLAAEGLRQKQAYVNACLAVKAANPKS